MRSGDKKKVNLRSEEERRPNQRKSPQEKRVSGAHRRERKKVLKCPYLIFRKQEN